MSEMDERRLTELFRSAADAAGDSAPPAAFDHADVLAGSRRAAARQRRRVGVALAVAVGLAGTGLVTAGVLTSPTGASSMLAGPSIGEPAPYAVAPEAAGRDAGPPSAGDAAAPKAAPAERNAAPAESCTPADGELFAQLVEELPAVRDAVPRAPSDGCRPGGRGVELDVVDGAARGVLRVVLVPAGSGGSDVQSQGGGSAVAVSVSARSGGQLRVTATSEAGPAPYAGQVREVARRLAARQ